MTEKGNGSTDLQVRVQQFNVKLIALLEEFRLGLGAEAFISSGQILAKPTLFDDSKRLEAEKATAASKPQSDSPLTKPE